MLLCGQDVSHVLIAEVGLGSVLSVLTKDSLLPESRQTHDSIIVSSFIFITVY